MNASHTSSSSSSEPLVSEQLLNACIHCGLCLSSCPTYRVTGSEAESPRGRLYLMRQWSDGRLKTAEDLGQHLDGCLGCLNCATVCPSGVEYGHLLNHYRSELVPQRASNPAARWVKRFAFQHVLQFPKRLQLLAFGLALYQRTGLQWLVRRSGLLPRLPIVGDTLAQMEALAPKSPNRTDSFDEGQTFGQVGNPLVALHTGCMMDTFFRRVHWATVHVLVANGYRVIIPKSSCCGALAHHSGEVDIAVQRAKETIEALEATQAERVIFNSAGCGAELGEYSALFETEPEWQQRAEALASKGCDVSELLAEKPLAPMTTPVHEVVTYHAACHLYHAQGVRNQPIDLLEQIPGLTLKPLDNMESCCGSAGIYNIEQPGLSRQVLAEKMACIQKTSADVIATGNPGCHLQLELGVRDEKGHQVVMHPVELLAKAYGH